MVKIRLKRVGKVKQPSYRVVVADSRSPRDGRIIEAIGHYNPRTDPSTIDIDGERALHWLTRGAQPSNQVRKLLQITGAWEAFTGEAPAVAATPTPTPAASVTATPAASVDETPSESEAETVAEAPEAPADEATEDEATEDEATEDEATEDEATEDEATEDEATEDEAQS